jgi:ribosomal protein S18 acetylase RimI-like enzyme
MDPNRLPQGWEIGVAPRARQGAALALVFDQLPQLARADHVAGLLSSARLGKVSLEGLLEARQGGQTLAAVWTQVQPGRSAGVWPPRFAPSVQSALRDAVADALLATVVECLSAHGVRIAQSLLPCDADGDAAPLARAGFRHLADLAYMVSVTDGPAPERNGELEFEPLSSHNESRLAKIVERTYEGTLDCPMLNGVREIVDVLAGHRAVGSFSPSRWLIVRRGQDDVGCLLLAHHIGESQLEIVYTGLVPEARGRGWGLAITRHAQNLTRSAGCSRLVLAVDAANAPAMRVYTAAGFTTWDRRRAWLRIF